MRSFVKMAFVLLATFGLSEANAQLSLGGQVSYLRWLGGTEIQNIGFGVNGEYATSYKTAIRGGINYYLPDKTEFNTSAQAIDFGTVPASISVPFEERISVIQLYVGGKRYFVGDYEESFNMYFIAEAGLFLVPVKEVLGDFDRSLYASSFEEDSETVTGFTLNFGIGAETELDFGYIFGDLRLNWPANTANGVAIAIEIPVSVSASVGVRVPF